MSPTYLYLIFFVEVIMFCLLIFCLYKADKWIKLQTQVVKQESPTIIDMIQHFKSEVSGFNNKFQEKLSDKPFEFNEFISFLSELATDIMKSFIPGFRIKRKIVYINLLYKVFKNKERIKSTLVRS